jgi:hypothetical protein
MRLRGRGQRCILFGPRFRGDKESKASQSESSQRSRDAQYFTEPCELVVRLIAVVGRLIAVVGMARLVLFRQKFECFQAGLELHKKSTPIFYCVLSIEYLV